jgi:SRSO17 transposase
VIIDHLPSFAQRFFRRFRSDLSEPQFTHLWALVLGLVINLRPAKLLHLSAVAPAGGHRTRCGAFLRGHWDAPALLHDAAMDLLGSMKPRPGEVLYLVLDDTRLPKRGSKTEWVSCLWCHKQQKFIKGHVVLTAAVVFRGVVLPWKIQLWKPKGHGGPRYRKLTNMAADMVRALQAPDGLKVRVLFDAFYLCTAVVKACESRAFTFFSVAQRNRSFTTPDGRKRKVADLMPGLIRHKGRNAHFKRSRGRGVCIRLARADGRLGRLGKVRMVVNKRPRGPWKKCIAVVTNETNLRARQILEIYQRRWPIEVLFKELAQDLGLGDYQMLQKDGIVNHLHVCCLAHLMLTHHSLHGLGEKARKPKEQVELPTMSNRLRDLRQRLARDELSHILKGVRHAKLRSTLLEHLQAAA